MTPDTNLPIRIDPLQVVATEHHNPLHIGRYDFTVELLNWNDEWPIFAHSVYELAVEETIGNRVHLIDVTATDRDVGDEVV